MAKTLLQGLNEVGRAVRIIAGDSTEFTSLTDASRQVFVDAIVRHWNDAVGELYASSEIPHPQELRQDSITLVTSDRSYVLATDLNVMRFPLLDETNGDHIFEFPGAYLDLRHSQPQPSNFTGQSVFAKVDPTNDEIYLDRIPTSFENGRVYQYWYDKDLELALAADTFPFKDIVFRHMVPIVTELFNRGENATFDTDNFRRSLGVASSYLTQRPSKTHY